MYPLVARFLEFNLIDEYNYQFACNNLEFKEVKAGEQIYSSRHLYKNFTIILKGKVVVKSVKNAVGYNKLGTSINTNFDEITKYAQERNSIEFEITKQEYSEKEYTKGNYFSGKNKHRSKNGTKIYSAVALEDTYVAYLDSKIYEILFNKSISKSEKERKNFLSKTLHTMKELGPSRFDVFFQAIEVNVSF